MQLLILQLSDLHVEGTESVALKNASRILDAVRGLEVAADAVLIAFSGDIAFSGKKEQYEIALDWFADIVSGVREAAKGLPVYSVLIPGNHDCDFDGPSAARNQLIEALPKSPALLQDPATIRTCLAVQDNFFEFRDAAGRDGLQDSKSRIYYEYLFEVEGTTIRVCCLNSAWLSLKKERVGSLLIPESEVPDDVFDDDIVLGMVHHPLGWLDPMNRREIRRRLQRSATVILTGHEHEGAAQSQNDEGGGSTLWVEGGALQEPGTSTSAFNAILVDSSERRFRILPFVWNGNGSYEAVANSFTDWTPLANPARPKGSEFPLTARMREELSDAGIDLQHPTRGRLRRDDIFVYPDLRHITDLPKAQPKIVSARRVLEIAAKEGCVLLTGARESGKTTLAKQLFLDGLADGLVPILLDGRTARVRGDLIKDKKELAGLFVEQYVGSEADYLAIDRERRMVVVDNYHSLPTATATATLASLRSVASLVVLLAHDVSQQVQDLVSLAARAGGSTVEHYRIMPYGHVRREEMIARYVALAAPGDVAKAERLRGEMRMMLDTALGKYYAPPVPVAIVSLLQARAFNDQLNLTQSTYGYYYELLIKRSLISGITGEMDVALGYLTSLVGELFARGQRRWDEAWWMDFHARFVKERALKLKFSDVVKNLTSREVVVERGAEYEFHYGYFYYYFAARALSDQLTDPAQRDGVYALTDRLDDEEVANVLLFLTHFTKDPGLIDAMLGQAAKLFSEFAPTDLQREHTEFPGLEEALRDVVYEARHITESREHYLSALDDTNDGLGREQAIERSGVADAAARVERTAGVDEMVTYVTRIYSAFRTMQILGQLLKNFPGTLPGAQKAKLTRAVYDIGLRVLASIYELFRARTDDTVEGVVEVVREQHPDISQPKLLERARNALYWYIYASTFGTVQRIATNVGTPLLELTFEQIETDDPSPAIRLISTALRLERSYTEFPAKDVIRLNEELQKNPLARRVLQGLVVTHFHLFDVDHDQRQRLCSELNIKYTVPAPQLRDKTRLLSSPEAKKGKRKP